MSVTRSQKVKAFTEEADKVGLKKESIAKLTGQDVDTVEILKLCSGSDVTDFALSKGQTLVLLQWIRQLCVDETSSESVHSQES